jgi:spermidine synthase
MKRMERTQQGATVAFEVKNVICDTHTNYSHVSLVNTVDHGRVLLMDGEVQFAEVDEYRYHETLVHPAMSRYERRLARVLILGGGDGLLAREVLKWDPSSVTIVDYDSQFIRTVVEPYLSDLNQHVYNDTRVRYVDDNAITYLRHCHEMFDVIFFDFPDPEGKFINLYHDCLHAIVNSSVLALPTGIIATHMGPVSLNRNHPSWTTIRNFYNTMQTLFGCTYVATFTTGNVPSFFHEWGFMYMVPKFSQISERSFGIANYCKYWTPVASVVPKDIQAILNS